MEIEHVVEIKRRDVQVEMFSQLDDKMMTFYQTPPVIDDEETKAALSGCATLSLQRMIDSDVMNDDTVTKVNGCRYCHSEQYTLQAGAC